MSQNIVLKVSGLQTSGSDYDGGPSGGLVVADNVEVRYKNVLEPRRGFQNLDNSQLVGENIIRITDFDIAGSSRIVCLTDLGNVYYYTSGPTPWVLIPGLSTGVIPSDINDAKSRFAKIALNLYLTSRDGIRSLASSNGSKMISAGVQKALDLSVRSSNGTSGFLSNNPVTTLAPVTLIGGQTIAGGLTTLSDISQLEVGQFVTGGQSTAQLTLQDIIYLSKLPGTNGNAITIRYTAGGVTGAEVVTVVGSAITISINTTPVTGSTAVMIVSAIENSGVASALVTALAQANNVQAAVAATNLTGGIDSLIESGTTITALTSTSTILVTKGDTAIGSIVLTNVPSIVGITRATVDPINATLVTGIGIPEGTQVFNYAGLGPFSVQLTNFVTQTNTNVVIQFSHPPTITLSQPVVGAGTSITFLEIYRGSQVKYQMLFGRVETDIDGNSVTRLGAPSATATLLNNWVSSTNTSVLGTIPKNCEDSLTFLQIYRTAISQSISIAPLEEYQLVYERQLLPADFTARQIYFDDNVTDSLRGASLYTGSNQEGIGQSNNPPPAAYDICNFRDFALYGNTTQPSTLEFSILAVGGGGGIALGDIIVITSGASTRSYQAVPITGGNLSDPFYPVLVLAPLGQFAVYLNGSPSQNITNTALSLIATINYDDLMPVHAIYLSTTTDLPGQILLESDYPIAGTFSITSGNNIGTGVPNPTPFDPVLTNIVSEINISKNGLFVSKSGLIEAVPATNVYFVGDSGSEILRVIASNNYVVILKKDGIYKVRGYSPSTLTIETFDLTTKVIGPDTAVGLNSDIWMFSNQGVVSINDSGVQVQSPPVQDQFDSLVAENLPNLKSASFAIGYESDKKYILCLPSGNLSYSDVQFGYNYFTNCWTTWSRKIQFGYVHKDQDIIYVARADGANSDVSFERASGTYQDYVDESFTVAITAISGKIITLTSVTGINVGDILFQTDDLYSIITDIDETANTLTVVDTLDFTINPGLILTGIGCVVTWQVVFGDNPAMTRQFSEGLCLFKRLNFNSAYISFSTNYARDGLKVKLLSENGDRWGLSGWGGDAWDDDDRSEDIRFLVPTDEQFSAYLSPTFEIRQAYSDFNIQGLSISYENASEEVGR